MDFGLAHFNWPITMYPARCLVFDR